MKGEPGGGPFWVKDERGSLSLQIVESAQINKKNKLQKDILVNATHFNPVDIVCGVKNYKGEPFDLKKICGSKNCVYKHENQNRKRPQSARAPRALEWFNGLLEHYFCSGAFSDLQSCEDSERPSKITTSN